MEQELEELRQKISSAKADAKDGDLSSAASDVTKNGRFDLRTRRILKGHTGKVADCQWAKNEPYVVSVAQDGTLIVWDATNGNKLHVVTMESIWVMTTSISPGGTLVGSAGMENLISLYNLSGDTSKPICQLEGHEGVVTDIHFATDTSILSTSGDQTCKVWDLERKTVSHTFKGHKGLVECVDVSEDGNMAVTGSCDKLCRLWDLREKNAVASFAGHENDINDVQFFPDSLAFGSASDDATCRLFDIRAQQSLQVYQHSNISCSAASLDFSSSGRIMFVGYHNSVCEMWDTRKAELTQGLEGHRERVSTVRVCPDGGQAVVTASWDQALRIWA